MKVSFLKPVLGGLDSTNVHDILPSFFHESFNVIATFTLVTSPFVVTFVVITSPIMSNEQYESVNSYSSGLKEVKYEFKCVRQHSTQQASFVEALVHLSKGPPGAIAAMQQFAPFFLSLPPPPPL